MRFVLIDLDDMLIQRGNLSARGYDAIKRLHDGVIPVLPVTTALPGWTDQMAHRWPVDGVIAEMCSTAYSP
ncbi:hypothetical protein [Azospirillum sp. B506]|uniref:hypothetical protein n=1 Tax=Azospirillum sp. B506 TaxID=137721 RepID=UPI0003486FBC|nr:hypothetical protein [Azospirillum sp. B506]